MTNVSLAAMAILMLLVTFGDIVDATDHAGRSRDAVNTCPRSCRCMSYEKVDCSRAGLTSLPLMSSSEMLYIYLEENSISEINNKSFVACPNIETLNLRENNLTDDSISRGTFSNLYMLRHLYLSDNWLSKIPNDLPSSLVTLNLEGNLIASLDGGILSRMKKLKKLYLHDNKITNGHMNKRALSQLKSLTEVTLANNLLSAIPHFPQSVEWVYLSGNQISDIRHGIFRKRKSLILLNLNNNILHDDGISSHAFSGLSGLEYLDLSMNKLKMVPVKLPRGLKQLRMEKNQLDHIPDEALAHLKSLEQLLLQDNKLNSTSFSEAVFSPLKSLRTLHIYGNKLDHIPHMLPPRLEVLMMMSNNIRYLRRETLLKTKKITELGLRNNKLTNEGLEKGALRSLSRLKTIDLTRNRLKALPTLPRSAEIVVLSDNRIARLPHNSVSRLKRVRELFLDGNKIKGIDVSFANLATLKRLDMSYNLLRTVPNHLPPNLEYLALTNNQLFEVRHDAFLSAPFLRDISLRDNDLSRESVNESAFEALPYLRNYDINWPG